jgi:hypothetical protein
MKKIALSVCGLLLGIVLFAQQAPKFPYPYEPKKDADFEKVQNQAVSCMKWYLNTPIKQYRETFEYMHRFLMIWTAGINTIPLALDSKVAAPLLEEKNKAKTQYYIVAYLSGMLLYQLDHRTNEDKAASQLEGLRAVIKFYQLNSDMLENSKAINKYIELDSSGKLDNWVNENLTKE